MINKLPIDQIVDIPTRKDNILDLFLFGTNQPSLINKVKSILGISKHCSSRCKLQSKED